MRNIWVAKIKGGLMFGDEHVPTFCDLDMLILKKMFLCLWSSKRAPPGKSIVV
jgi:hypothetical protein